MASTVLLFLLGLLSVVHAQKIQTNTNTEGAYTTGNKLDLPDELALYAPPRFDIPMLIERDLYESIVGYQSFKDNWIIDISDIDPKVFAPEDPNYTLAVQRRGIPYFYLGKAIIIGTLLLLIGRLFYGYLGGFRQKVKILKSHEKRLAIRIVIVGAVIYFLISTPYIITTFLTVQLSEQFLTNVILKRAQDSDDTLVNVYNTIEQINTSGMPAYYAENEFEMFHISNRLESLLPESKQSIKTSTRYKEDFEKFQNRHLARTLLITVAIYLLLVVIRYAYKNRKIYYSVVSAFSLLLLIVACCVQNGFYFNFATVKIEMCSQSSEIVRLNKFPLFASGVSAVVSSFSNVAKTNMQEQIYEFNTAIYSAFVMYCNRLKAIGKYSSYTKIKTDAANKVAGVWNVFFDYAANKYQDEILKSSYDLIKLIWRMYYQVESLLEARMLKFWAFQYANNVCRLGVAYDVANFSNNFLIIMSIMVIFIGAWMSEYIIRCIIYEESRFMNVEKYRHDWA